jgi:hypothetical protein
MRWPRKPQPILLHLLAGACLWIIFVSLGGQCIDYALAQDAQPGGRAANHVQRITEETTLPIKVVVGVCVLAVGVSGMWLETRLEVKALRREVIGIRDEDRRDVCDVQKFIDVRFLEEWDGFDEWAAALVSLNPNLKLPVRKRGRVTGNLRSDP